MSAVKISETLPQNGTKRYTTKDYACAATLLAYLQLDGEGAAGRVREGATQLGHVKGFGPDPTTGVEPCGLAHAMGPSATQPLRNRLPKPRQYLAAFVCKPSAVGPLPWVHPHTGLHKPQLRLSS